MSKLEEIQGNWEYERAIKPEDVDYLLERVEELENQDNGKVNLLNTIGKLRKRAEELEKEIKGRKNFENRRVNQVNILIERSKRYKQFVRNIANAGEHNTDFRLYKIKARQLLAGDKDD